MLYGLQERNSKAKTWVYHVKRLLSTDLDMYGCIEKLVTKDGFCIYLKNVLSGHIYVIVKASIFIIVLRAHFSVKDI